MLTSSKREAIKSGGRGGYSASLGSVHRGGQYSKSRPGVDGNSNTVHPWFIFHRWIEHVRPIRLGRQRTWSSLSACQAAAAARELDDANAMAKAGGPGPAHLWRVVLHARGIAGRVRRELRRRSAWSWRTALAARALWSVGPLARTSSLPPPPAAVGFLLL